MRVAAIILCVIAIAAMTMVVRDKIVGADNGRRGWLLRTVALVAFVLAVILNVARVSQEPTRPRPRAPCRRG